MQFSSKTLPIFAAAASLALASCKKQDSVQNAISANSQQQSELSVEQPQTVLTYIVKKGDTLGKIAKHFKVDLDDLKEANNIDDPNLIKIGQPLLIYSRPYDQNAGERSDYFRQEVKKQDIKESQQQKADTLSTLSKGDVPVLNKNSMPVEAREYSRKIGNLIRKYALDQKLGIVGPPYCGQGVCTAFNANKNLISGLGSLDAVFADRQFYQQHFGSPSRDAWKIRQVLDTLASREDSGWVKVDINDFAKSFGPVVRKASEGSMYRPYNLPDGVIVCYDPNPQKLGNGSGAEAHGHIEWLTKDSKGVCWHVHAINSEVHGGSVWGRKQLHKAVKHGADTCHVYMLTTPEIKEKWLARDLAMNR